MFVGIIKSFAKQHNFAANAFGLHDLNRWRWHGHYDGHRNTKARTMIAQPLRMVAGGRRDHALATLFLGKKQDRV